VGAGVDHTIKEIAQMVADATGFKGETLWDTSKPDGTPQKVLDVSKLESSGFQPKNRLEEGIVSTVRNFLDSNLGFKG
jgi:GDP-L-fucose synthase